MDIEANFRAAEHAEIDFTCHVCGAECPIAPQLPGRAVCAEHCEDHDFEYRSDVAWHHCKHCDKPVHHDFYDLDVLEEW